MQWMKQKKKDYCDIQKKHFWKCQKYWKKIFNVWSMFENVIWTQTSFIVVIFADYNGWNRAIVVSISLDVGVQDRNVLPVRFKEFRSGPGGWRSVLSNRETITVQVPFISWSIIFLNNISITFILRKSQYVYAQRQRH